MQLSTDGRHLVDEHGRRRVLHGINLVAKGTPGDDVPEVLPGEWGAADVAELADLGLNAVRLGVNWAATEPAPGRYSRPHLDWIGGQLDLLHAAGLHVVLDAHQDLFSQRFDNGAPAWATLATTPFDPAALWSDAYASSAAVHEAYDAFWANAPGPGGVGIQDRFAAMWRMLAERFGSHPAVIGYDVLNEPAPGAASAAVLDALVGAFAELTEQDPELLGADLAEDEGRLAQLAHLEDPRVHRGIGDRLAPVLEPFEREQVHALFRRVVPAIRSADAEGVILREHGYFSNLGVPSPMPPLEDHAWAYSPHGYDLLVDTDAMVHASDRRIATIFERAAETGGRLGVPVVVGEWGGFYGLEGIGRHARFQLDMFDAFGWSWFYWAWEPGFADTEAAAELRRPRPVAVAGSDVRWGSSARTDARWSATWSGTAGSVTGAGTAAPSEFWVPAEREVALSIDGRDAPVQREGSRLVIESGPGGHLLQVW